MKVDVSELDVQMRPAVVAVHLMMVFCIANLNDRSLAGDRDSEVCIILEDKELVCT